MKKTMLLTITATGLLAACTLFEPDPILPAGTDYSIIDGDTVKTRVEKGPNNMRDEDLSSSNFFIVGNQIVTYKETKLHTPPSRDPDLTKIKNNDDPDLKGKPFRMVAIGGSLTAGVRDGGYFNEGIITSYPNLVARQMKLKKFEQPLFDATDFNGFGRKVQTDFNPTGGPVPKYNVVINNTGIETIDPDKKVKLKRYKGDIDNFAVPSQLGAMYTPTHGAVSNLRFSKKGLIELAKRVSNNDNESVTDNLFKSKFDAIIIETGFEEIWSKLFNDGIGSVEFKTDLQFFEGNNFQEVKNLIEYNVYQSKLSPAFIMVAESKRRKVKAGCILNTPNFLNFPYFKIISKKSVDDVYQLAQKDIISGVAQYLPSSTIDSIVSPKVHINLKPWLQVQRQLNDEVKSNLMTESKIGYFNFLLDAYNTDKVLVSKKFGYPVVDIKKLFDDILKGNYTTNDGVRVDPSWPSGNFFSNDGLSPTAFGQAIIANEVIKVLNSTYKIDIPLIPTKEYLTVK